MSRRRGRKRQATPDELVKPKAEQLFNPYQPIEALGEEAAMAAVGLGTSFTRLRGLGLRPLGVGLFAAAVVGGVSYLLIRTFAPYIIELTS